ncbi:MAG: TIGR00725 family protein [bacterium]
MRKLIGVCGSDSTDLELSSATLKTAEQVGYYIAQRGGVLICGGKGGVMEQAAKGAKRAQGLTVGILPDAKEKANRFIDIAIATHFGYARNYILINSADAVIGIAGRWGTLNEISYSLNIGKPTVVIKGSGGWMDILSNEAILKKLELKPHIVDSAKEAVDLAFKLSE